MIKSCGAVVYRQLGKQLEFLLIKTKAGNTDFPKGRQEQNETDLVTATREILEETNYHVIFEPNFKEVITFTLLKHGDLKQVTLFLAKAKEKGNHQIDPDEITEVMWMPYEEALKAISFENSREVLTNAKAYIDTYLLLN